MDQVSSVAALRAWRNEARSDGARVALVPTMGALHEGHLALVDEARRLADRVVMSVFVNPLQFRPGEDFDRYPRDLVGDAGLAAARGVDLLFTPDVATMYPPGSETRIVPGSTSTRWEGAARPGHFEGVLTVVAKLFHLVEPTVALFGQKDIQQVTLIRRMVADLDWPITLRVVPTVREADGLALSSRNRYLNPSERTAALALSRGLRAAQAAFEAGERSAAALEREVMDAMADEPLVHPEYIAVTDPVGLEPVSSAEPGTIIAVAARLGATRLIDNVMLGEEGV